MKIILKRIETSLYDCRFKTIIDTFFGISELLCSTHILLLRSWIQKIKISKHLDLFEYISTKIIVNILVQTIELKPNKKY